MNIVKCNLLKTFASTTSTCVQVRNHAKYKPEEHHIRFDVSDGRKRPCGDVLDRFKRLNNGLWIRGRPGRNRKRYMHDDAHITKTLRHESVTPIEGQILERMVTRYWVKPKYFIEDPYQPYHVRHGLTAPRMGFDKKLCRERPKILLEDTVADQHFYDR